MAIKDLVKDQLGDIDKPIPDLDVQSALPFFSKIFSKGKIKCVIHYEDGTYVEYLKKFKKPYVILIKKAAYYFDPKAVITSKNPTMHWFYNNPVPIHFKFQHTSLANYKLPRVDETFLDKNKLTIDTIPIDGEAFKALISSNIIKNMYASEGITPKTIFLFLIVGVIVLLVILQMTGQIDVMGFISGTAGG